MNKVYKLSTLLLFLMILGNVNYTSAQTAEADSLALVDLYNECGGTDWSGFDSWLNGPISTWEKVTVDSATQRVTHVEFKDMALVGTLPASLGNLDQMGGKIEFRDDVLSGEMPSLFWKWVNVERFQMKFAGYTSVNTDGMENMVNLTEFNTEGTPISGMAPAKVFTLPSMVKVYMHNNEIDALPAEFASVAGLDRLYLNGNNLTELPDMSGIVWKDGAKVRFQDNNLTFEDLESNVVLTEDTLVAEFNYSPQAVVGEAVNMFPALGSDVELVAGVGGSANTYTWVKGEDDVVGDSDTLTIAGFDASLNSGNYYALVQSSLVPGLDITTAPVGLFESPLAIDSLALVDLYNDCGGADWGFDTWLSGPISTWQDVTVDSATQRVTHVEFSRMTLTGTLPASLGNLDKMSGKIQLNDQPGLTGELPAFVWNWVDVDRFQVKKCGFTSMDVTGMENMVNLTEFNSEGTPIAGMVPGILFNLPAMEKLYLHDSEYDALPAEFASVSGLDRLYLNGNNLTELPDMSSIIWKDGAKVRVQNNSLTFEDLESNVVLTEDTLVAEFNYSPQGLVGEETVLSPAAGSNVQLVAEVGGTANSYVWVKGEEQVGESDTFTIEAYDLELNSGTYYALVQNTLVPGLDIQTANTYLLGNEPMLDSLALVDLYNDCGGSEWSGFGNWLNGPINTWEAITIDSVRRRVVGIDFKNMNLTGTLPATLGDLDELSGKVEFRDDSLLVGEIPSFLWNWVKVDRIQFKFTGFTSVNTDGMENMVNLTEFNTEGSPIGGMAPGKIFTLPSMVKVYMHDNNLDDLPAELATASGLDRLYLNGNQLKELPDMSGIVWADGAKVRVQENNLTFEDLESNMVLTQDTLVAEFNYSPQANVGLPEVLELNSGDTLRLAVNVGGTANTYTWFKGEDDVIAGATESNLQIDSVAVEDSGEYGAFVQNTLVPGLDIFSNKFTVTVTPPSGTEEIDFEGLKVYGNPVNERIILTSDENISDLFVYDVNGKMVMKFDVNAQNVDVNVTGLNAGLYIILIANDAKYQTIKFVKK
ncbi:T9SS type A sorting domain-containing protein [Portibacter lacus]|uniref:Ig-like domain-containing protein n=1 Tax=Portibacter lacus TaxID=1099794 RepID=A0AA37WEX6_9BACT|nr:T9SS type A sorting domain-containing protein [Portibacter lacus]GLR17892.1 hypothetical protein GCM10007940_25070 [Portibacter lacus]